MSHDGKREDDPPGGDPPPGDQHLEESPSGDSASADSPSENSPSEDSPSVDKLDSTEQSLRGSVELPRVVLGSEESTHRAPRKRVLPGLVDLRWLSYPAYIACFLGGGIAVNFAIDVQEWAAPPIAIAWAMLFFWEWIYGVAYGYRRRVLKYFSLLLVVGLSVALAAFCWDRAEPQLVAQTQGFVSGALVQRGHVDSLDWAGVLALVSGALITLHAAILGRGYRKTDGYARDDRRDTKQTPPSRKAQSSQVDSPSGKA